MISLPKFVSYVDFVMNVNIAMVAGSLSIFVVYPLVDEKYICDK